MVTLTPQIIAETPDWVVVDKPAGWLSIAGRGEKHPILLDWVKSRFSETKQGGIHVVHRLDRETSGVVLFARGAEAHRRASLWFQKRENRKIYACLAWGSPALPVFKVQAPIEGSSCATQIEVKERFSSVFFAQIRPLTGRRHQIRIHLSAQGHPLLGDPLYGGARSVLLASGASLEIPRVALHAMVLELPTGERFEAPLAEDFSSWLKALRAGDPEGTRGDRRENDERA